MKKAHEDDWRLRQQLRGEMLCVEGKHSFFLAHGGATFRHTVSPKLAQVAAVLERLVEHQEGKRLRTWLVLQKPVRLPLEDRSHHEEEVVGCFLFVRLVAGVE